MSETMIGFPTSIYHAADNDEFSRTTDDIPQLKGRPPSKQLRGCAVAGGSTSLKHN